MSASFPSSKQSHISSRTAPSPAKDPKELCYESLRSITYRMSTFLEGTSAGGYAVHRVFHLPFLFDLILCILWAIPRASSSAWSVLTESTRVRVLNHRSRLGRRS